MKVVTYFSLICLLIPNCVAIYKGNPARKHEFPYQVGILLINESIDDPVICSGGILNADWIISTVSCLKAHIPDNLNVVADAHYISTWTNYVHRKGISKVISHPDYDYSSKPNAPYDVALAKLSSPLELGDHVKSVTLPERGVYPKGTGWVAGWGGTFYIYMRPNDLMKAEVRVSHRNGCIESVAGPIFCASHSNHSPICKWDDGAPLVQKNDDGELVLIGIATVPFIPQNSNKCPSSTQSSKFAMISQLRDWIEQNLK